MLMLQFLNSITIVDSQAPGLLVCDCCLTSLVKLIDILCRIFFHVLQ
jgi:hypothetical protein